MKTSVYKVVIIQIVYNSRKFLEPVFSSIFRQTHKDLEVIAVISGNEDKSKEYLQEHFPQVKVIDPGYNIGFSKGHNVVFEQSDADYFQLVNPDLILESNFVEKMLTGFDGPQIGVVSGKLLHYDFEKNQTTKFIDSTGVTMTRGGRGRDRGQHEIDNGQYDSQLDLIGASGAGMMLSKKALEAVKFRGEDGRWQYFDESFHSYWEDVDLTWRIVNAGYRCRYVPEAVAYHGRAAASSVGGYLNFVSFVKHHKKINPRIRQLNFKNHIYLYLKNSPKLYLQFFVREFFMWLYILFFEFSTFKALPDLIKNLPRVLQRRKDIQANRKANIKRIEQLFVK